MYICWRCKKDVKKLDQAFIRCPYCACRVLFKARQPIAREIKAQ